MHNERAIVLLYGALTLGVCAGCASSSVAPLRVRAADWRPSRPLLARQPLVIDFKAGDRIPVTIQLDGEIVETTPSPSVIWLTAKRDFSVRIQGSEIKTSLDGKHFDDKPAQPGRFQIGLGPTPEGGPKLSVHVTTPVHAKP
jgi:hypothetical protein